MRKLLLVLAIVAPLPAFAQSAQQSDTRALVVSSCGAQAFPLTAGGYPNYAPLTELANGTLCTQTGTGGGGGSVTQGTSPWVDNISQWAGTALGTPSAYGTAPTGNAPGVNAFVTNFPASFALNAGSAIVGKFDIDQTTPGTTNGVQVNASALPSGAATSANQTNVQTAPGTAASTVLNVQGSALGVPLPTNQTQMAGTALGAPTAYGTAPTGNVAGVNASVTASALPSGAATAANQTNVQSAAGTSAGTATTVQGNASGVPVPVSSSTLATAANQSTQIASETTIAQRAITYTDTTAGSVPSSGTYTGTIRDLGAAPSYSRVNAGVYSGTTNITLNIQGCIDSACNFYINLASVPVSAAATGTATASFLTRYYRVTVVNGSSSAATTIQLVTSFTAN